MLETAARRKHINNTNLYRHLDHRKPRPFLERNLTQALLSHERSLSLDGPNDEAAMIPERRRAAQWAFPTSDMISNFMQGQRPALGVDEIKLRLPKSAQTLSRPPDEACHITVLLLDKDNQIVHEQSSVATALWTRKRRIDISLVKPFRIELDTLYQARRSTDAMHTIEISISCSALASVLDDAEGKVKAVWDRLPLCPSTQQRLPLQRIKPQGNTHESKCGMEVSMGWSRRSASVLQTYNRVRKELPISRALGEASDKCKPVTIRYSYHEGLEVRAHTSRYLNCVWCESRSDFHNFRHLMLHYLTWHEDYDFEVQSPPGTSGADVIDVSFTLIENCQNSKDSIRASRECAWIVPSRPFDITAYINGDRRWTDGQGQSRRYMHEAAGRAANKRKLDDVADARVSQRRKLAAPIPPANVTFYHMSSMQPMQPGDLLDMECNLHDDRLVLSTRNALRALGLSGGALEFHESFNRHMDVEQCSSRRLTEGAIARFAQMHTAKRSDTAWQREFKAKMDLLQENGIVGEALAAQCLAPSTATPAALIISHDPDTEMQDAGPADGPPYMTEISPTGRYVKESPSASAKPNGDSGMRHRIASLQPDEKLRYRWEGGSFNAKASTSVGSS